MGSKVFWSWKLLSIWGRFLALVLISNRACMLRDVSEDSSEDSWICQNLILLHSPACGSHPLENFSTCARFEVDLACLEEEGVSTNDAGYGVQTFYLPNSKHPRCLLVLSTSGVADNGTGMCWLRWMVFLQTFLGSFRHVLHETLLIALEWIGHPLERRHSALHPNLLRNLVTRCGSDRGSCVMVCTCCVHAYLYVAMACIGSSMFFSKRGAVQQDAVATWVKAVIPNGVEYKGTSYGYMISYQLHHLKQIEEFGTWLFWDFTRTDSVETLALDIFVCIWSFSALQLEFPAETPWFPGKGRVESFSLEIFWGQGRTRQIFLVVLLCPESDSV